MYKHSTYVIDPRDPHLVGWNKETKRFVVEASDLHGAGIRSVSEELIKVAPVYTPTYQLYSNEFDTVVMYEFLREERDREGELIATIFVPDECGCIDRASEMAFKAAKGTELHILND